MARYIAQAHVDDFARRELEERLGGHSPAGRLEGHDRSAGTLGVGVPEPGSPLTQMPTASGEELDPLVRDELEERLGM